MRLKHTHAILLSGFIWLGVGALLLTKGIQYLVLASSSHAPLISLLGKSGEQGALMLISIALLLGFIKGRFVLKKTVNRVVERIRSFPSPFPLKQLYSKGYFILLGAMMCIGMVFKVLPLPLDVKGFIDFTIGAALINGAMLYLRAAFAYKPSD